MRKLLLTLALAAALPMSTPAFAHDHSGASAESLVGASYAAFISVAVVGSFVAESVTAVTESGGKLSDALRGREHWHVTVMTPAGEQTRVMLREQGGDGRLEVTMQTARIAQIGLRPHDELLLTPMGKTGHALRRGDTLVALVTDKDHAMGQSAVRP